MNVVRDGRTVQVNWTQDFSTWAGQVGVSADEALRKTDFGVYQGVLDAAFDTKGVNSFSINGAWRPSFGDYQAVYNEMKRDPTADKTTLKDMKSVITKYGSNPWSPQHVTSRAIDINRIGYVDVNGQSWYETINNENYTTEQPNIVNSFTQNLRIEGAKIVLQPWEMWYAPTQKNVIVNDGIDVNIKRQNAEKRHSDHLHIGW